MVLAFGVWPSLTAVLDIRSLSVKLQPIGIEERKDEDDS